MRNRRISTLALSAIGGLLLAACNTTLTLNTDNLERLVQTGIQAQNPGVTVSAVDCPERPLQQGDVFTCSAATSAGNVTVRVTQTDAQGNVNWEVVTE